MGLMVLKHPLSIPDCTQSVPDYLAEHPLFFLILLQLAS